MAGEIHLGRRQRAEDPHALRSVGQLPEVAWCTGEAVPWSDSGDSTTRVINQVSCWRCIGMWNERHPDKPAGLTPPGADLHALHQQIFKLRHLLTTNYGLSETELNYHTGPKPECSQCHSFEPPPRPQVVLDGETGRVLRIVSQRPLAPGEYEATVKVENGRLSAMRGDEFDEGTERVADYLAGADGSMTPQSDRARDWEGLE